MKYVIFASKGKRIKKKAVKPLITYLKTFLKGYKYEFVGSYRRGKAEIGDLEVLIQNADLPGILTKLERSKVIDLKSIIAHGKSKLSVLVNIPKHKIKNLQLEFYTSKRNNWGAAMLHYTGPASLNIAYRVRAKKNGYEA